MKFYDKKNIGCISNRSQNNNYHIVCVFMIHNFFADLFQVQALILLDITP